MEQLEIARRQEQLRKDYTIDGDGMRDEYGQQVYRIVEETDGTFSIRDARGHLVDMGGYDRGEARRVLEDKMESIIERDGERQSITVHSVDRMKTLKRAQGVREHEALIVVGARGRCELLLGLAAALRA